jgi:hypothetical protein
MFLQNRTEMLRTDYMDYMDKRRAAVNIKLAESWRRSLSSIQPRGTSPWLDRAIS